MVQSIKQETQSGEKKILNQQIFSGKLFVFKERYKVIDIPYDQFEFRVCAGVLIDVGCGRGRWSRLTERHPRPLPSGNFGPALRISEDRIATLFFVWEIFELS